MIMMIADTVTAIITSAPKISLMITVTTTKTETTVIIKLFAILPIVYDLMRTFPLMMIIMLVLQRIT